ncbi:54S ribosomal protein, mitochondrial [Orbilia brochopaga]|uniref:Large ribosomal subunit protein uL4m n=1 Tax=Orbilia brochopaga TaxID=3140254 RepID=A0AAV9UYL5_9PEZI
MRRVDTDKILARQTFVDKPHLQRHLRYETTTEEPPTAEETHWTGTMASCSSSSTRLLCRSGASWRRPWGRPDSCSIPNSIGRLVTRRSMATEASLPSESANDADACIKVFESQPAPPMTRQELLLTPPPVIATLYKFPTLEPIQFYKYDAKFLHLPLRSDILHRAIVYEGNAHRLGRAKTKWRGEIRASGRKLRPQKGTGRARLGNASSPMLRGGAKAHGPKPRDFSTDLPRKVYDLAFRTALSYRYRKGELIIIGEAMQPQHSKTRYMRQVMIANRWGAGNGKTLFITITRRNNLWCALNMLEHHGRVMRVQDVDVKDLLEAGRVVIEQHALHYLGEKHGALPPRKTPSERRAERRAAKLAERAAQEQQAEAVEAVAADASAVETVVEEVAEQAVDAESTEMVQEISAEAAAETTVEATTEASAGEASSESPTEPSTAATSQEAGAQSAPESTSSTSAPPSSDSNKTTSSS